MKERQQEINVHLEMLKAQMKIADKERSQISKELHERISKIDKLKKRFELHQICSLSFRICYCAVCRLYSLFPFCKKVLSSAKTVIFKSKIHFCVSL